MGRIPSLSGFGEATIVAPEYIWQHLMPIKNAEDFINEFDDSFISSLISKAPTPPNDDKEYVGLKLFDKQGAMFYETTIQDEHSSDIFVAIYSPEVQAKLSPDLLHDLRFSIIVNNADRTGNYFDMYPGEYYGRKFGFSKDNMQSLCGLLERVKTRLLNYQNKQPSS
jgi:hypothetical protein